MRDDDERKELQKTILQNDLKEVLSTESGRRIVGSIFHLCRKDAGTLSVGSFAHTAFQEGMRAVAVVLAGDIREIDPHLVAECEIAYAKFVKRFQDEDEKEGEE